MRALGRLFDIGVSVAPVDLNTADAATGKRLWMGDCQGITVVTFTGVGGAENITFTVREHTAHTSGTSRDLDVVTESFIKAETALDNDESWVSVTSAAGDQTIVGATYGAQQKLHAFYVDASQMSDDCAWLSVDTVLATSSTAQLFAQLYLKHDLKSQRDPTLLPNLLNPAIANA